jgi:putative addiction module component (TIGR02574 family)
MTDYQSVLAVATQLPVGDRMQLIEDLWDSVPHEALPPLSSAWIDEIERRSKEFDTGAVQSVPWDEIKADALRRAGVAMPDASN